MFSVLTAAEFLFGPQLCRKMVNVLAESRLSKISQQKCREIHDHRQAQVG